MLMEFVSNIFFLFISFNQDHTDQNLNIFESSHTYIQKWDDQTTKKNWDSQSTNGAKFK